jgi:oxygen-dependent protoporphyrinogen oxidase
MMPVLKTPLLGWGTKIRMGLEFFRGPASHADRSVAEFVIDHFGRETLDYLAEPLLAGVYGGDPEHLSVASVLPRFVEMEKTEGSLARAVMRSRASAAHGGTIFRTLKSGLGKLVEALSGHANVRWGGAQSLSRDTRGWRVRVEDDHGADWVQADDVVLACPAWSAAELVADCDGTLAELLRAIPYTSSAIVTLIYRSAEFDGMHAGFGFLVPRVERRRLLACTFMGTKFSHRAPADKVVLRCFFGGAGDDSALSESDEALAAAAREELRRIIGLSAGPIFTRVSRWPRSMAQYTVGHAERLREIEARTTGLPGLHLAGNAYTGIGIPDCIRMGRAAAERIVSSISRPS